MHCYIDMEFHISSVLMCLEPEAQQPADDNTPKLISVKFSRTETERARKARERSFRAMEQRIREEPWLDVLYRPRTSREGEVGCIFLIQLKLLSGL